MKILLIGKSGQLGGSLIRANESHDICAPDRSELDIESTQSCTRWMEAFQPDCVINTAAFHNVPQCEIDPGRAFEVNCLALGELAALCRNLDAKLVTFSTDYVFSGEQSEPYLETDLPRPLQQYGISRLAGERAAMATAPGLVTVVRTCGLYGPAGASSKGGNFVDQRLADARRMDRLEMSCEQIVAPTYSMDLAHAVLSLIEAPGAEPCIYHLVNEGQCSWFQFTQAIYEIAGIDMLVSPVDRGGMNGNMRRPIYSVLANTRAKSLGITLPHWRDALERYLSVTLK